MCKLSYGFNPSHSITTVVSRLFKHLVHSKIITSSEPPNENITCPSDYIMRGIHSNHIGRCQFLLNLVCFNLKQTYVSRKKSDFQLLWGFESQKLNLWGKFHIYFCSLKNIKNPWLCACSHL